MPLTRIEITMTSDGGFSLEFCRELRGLKESKRKKCADLPEALRAIRQEFEPPRVKAKSNGVKAKDTSQARKHA